jgi:hypothetical protein
LPLPENITKLSKYCTGKVHMGLFFNGHIHIFFEKKFKNPWEMLFRMMLINLLSIKFIQFFCTIGVMWWMGGQAGSDPKVLGPPHG